MFSVVFHKKMASSTVLCFIRKCMTTSSCIVFNRKWLQVQCFIRKRLPSSLIPEKPHQPRGTFDQCSQKKLLALINTVVKKMTYSVATYIAKSKRSVYGLLMLIQRSYQ